jgi:hypothetical protein
VLLLTRLTGRDVRGPDGRVIGRIRRIGTAVYGLTTAVVVICVITLGVTAII